MDLDGIRFVIDTMEWSFSRLNSFRPCPYRFLKHYVECEDMPTDLFFAAYGSFCHKVIEKYLKGELKKDELAEYYEWNFGLYVKDNAPENKSVDIRQDFYDKGLEYFSNIDIPVDRYEVVGVEKEVRFNLCDYPFVGYIDILFRDPADGKYILCDNKSAKIDRLKSGGIAKRSKPLFEEFKIQQYLYSKAVNEEFGEGSVKGLQWNLFKTRDWISIMWDEKDYEKALAWALGTIHLIEEETEWKAEPEWFKCSQLCGFSRDVCPYRA